MNINKKESDKFLRHPKVLKYLRDIQDMCLNDQITHERLNNVNKQFEDIREDPEIFELMMKSLDVEDNNNQ